MANLLQTLIPLLSSISLLLMLANHTLSQSTYFSFDSFRSKLTHLTYQGDAHVPSGSSLLRLTKTDAAGHPQMDSVGRVLYSKPLQFWKPDNSVINFKTTIKFTIKPLKGYPAGDGLAFFIVPEGSTIPGSASGGNLGIVDVTGTSAALVAVEFDLYRNEWDPSRHPHHIGVDINSIKSSKVASFGSRCIGQQVQLHIDYDGYTLHVVLNCGHETKILEYECDLKSILPQKVQVGIAASTGSHFALHDIHFWRFNSSMEINPHHASNITNIA